MAGDISNQTHCQNLIAQTLKEFSQNVPFKVWKTQLGLNSDNDQADKKSYLLGDLQA